MNSIAQPVREQPSFALLTDLYQLTMACAYWKSGTADKEAAFHLSFRTAPFQSGYTVACGLGPAIEFIQNFRFTKSDLDFLAAIPGDDKKPLFGSDFLDYLGSLKFSCDIDAISEGTVVFPHEPLLLVQGPILQAQLLETPLLNFLNFQSLIVTQPPPVSMPVPGAPLIQFRL